ncbi:CAMK/CAMK1 protein kinase [Saprolegnia parasitica CBS 223.65]|uniref:CAMK/CAMK1 protein kinase n=1 Tax=Saprolegnia parasitica (strain CBS 223.65) TaxID=695850 RepID=A0A067CU09_SAPPC|nr:CAMK/CAMK1 protein kinase [Saprolegnia parasitica CBS 223.65]KDO30036.1 CAMK/CAMK1 protein kinase [Saprolegnia parasitica CBS 223.65]|eukprot:XP_012199218.1 CAMK/CAMK1 protein kinase [Saprolegnia parasitica CBS 223.65]
MVFCAPSKYFGAGDFPLGPAVVLAVLMTMGVYDGASAYPAMPLSAFPWPAFEAKYVLGPVLGYGSYSILMEKAGMTPDEMATVPHEVHFMRRINHPLSLQLLDFFEDDVYFYLVSELLQGGTLFDRIITKDHFSEDGARAIVRQLVQVIECCHQRGVIHGDLKPENILMVHDLNETGIKVGDYGCASTVADAMDPSTTRFCGTLAYAAPEIHDAKPYGTPVDIWSIGVIAFILLCGNFPFSDPEPLLLSYKVTTGDYTFHESEWSHVSDEAKEFIAELLSVDPARRPTATALLAHPWLQHATKKTTEHSMAAPEIVTSLLPTPTQRYRKCSSAVLEELHMLIAAISARDASC